MRILAEALRKISCYKFFMTQSKKGHTFAMQGPTKKKKKNTCALIFVLMLHIKFQVPSSRGSLVLQPTAMLYW